MFFICIIMIILFNTINKQYLKTNYKILNPLSIFIYVWFFVLIVHKLYFEKQYYTNTAYILILSGITALAIGFWLFAKTNIVNVNRCSYVYNEDIMKKILFILTIIEILRLIYMSYVVYSLAGSFSMFLSNNTYVRNLYLVRESGLIENFTEFFLNINAMLGYVTVGIYSTINKKIKIRYIFVWSLLELLYAIVTMSKMCFIVFLSVLFITCMNNLINIKIQKRIFLRYIPILALVIFGFLLVIGKQRNYSQFGESIVQVVINKAFFYFSGSVEALAKYISLYTSEVALGKNSFTIFYRVLSRLNIVSNNSILSSHSEFIDIAHESTNVYTFFRTFYMDYSFAGFIIGPFLMGTVAGLFYNPKRTSFFCDVCTSWVSSVLALSFYSYMWGQSIYIIILLYAYFIDKVFGEKLYLKQDF